MSKWFEKLQNIYYQQASYFLSAISAGEMTIKEEKLYRQPDNILSRPAEHPIWEGVTFWKHQWPNIVDNAAGSLESAAQREAEMMKWLQDICDFFDGRLINYDI